MGASDRKVYKIQTLTLPERPWRYRATRRTGLMRELDQDIAKLRMDHTIPTAMQENCILWDRHKVLQAVFNCY